MKLAVLTAAVFLLIAVGIGLLLYIPDKSKEDKKRDFKGSSKMKSAATQWQAKKSELLHKSKMPLPLYYAAVVVCAFAGYWIGKLVFSSPLISVCVGTICTLLPLAYLSYRKGALQNQWLEKLCASMMILSNSYVVTQDFITSVEQNLEMLDIREPFQNFLVYTRYVDSDIESGLRRIENQVGNPYFSQWIDALAMAQRDRALCYVTVAIVESMRDALTVQAEANAAMSAVWRDYFMVLILIFCVPLIFKFMMADAYQILTTSLGGQALLMLLLVCIAISVFFALKLTKPKV